nr:hypothetical protein [Tanacetum cinerariifolium]
MLPIELTNDEIKNTKAYKEYYACATGEAAPKPKASARRKRNGSDTSITPPTVITTPTTTVFVTPRLTVAAKGKQPAKAKSSPDPSDVARTEAQQLKIVLRRSRQQMHISQLGGFGTDEGTDTDAQEKDRDDDEGDEKDKSDDGEEDDAEDKDGLRISEEERLNEKEEADELYRDIDINQGRGLQLSQDIKDSHVTLTPVNPDGQQESSSVSSQFVTSMLNPTSDAGMESIFMTASSPMAPLQTSTPIITPSTIATITTISHAQIPPTTIPSEVKGQVKEQVSRILPRIEQFVNAQLESEVLTRSSHSSRTSYAVAADLSEMELKKILIEKMEGNKSIQRSDEQRNLYKALVEAYEADKIILDTYGETVTLKRRRDDESDKDEGPSVGSDRGSKRQKKGKEPESASTPLQTVTRSADRSTTGSKTRQVLANEFAFAEEPVQTTCQMDEPSYLVFETDHDWNKTLPAVQGSTQTWISELAKQADSRSSFNELLDTPLDFSNFIMNRLRVDILTPELLAGPTFELMKASCTSLIELEYHLEEVYKATMDQLDWVNPEGQQGALHTITTISHTPIPSTTISSAVLQNLPTFDSVFRFDDRLKSLESNFSEYRQTNPFAEAVSNIPVAADLSEMELKKILTEKMEGNKSIQCSDEQRNLYKALVDTYEADKTILNSYGETVILKRRRDDDDDDQEEGPSAGSDWGSKRWREGKEPESASAPLETTTRSTGMSTTGVDTLTPELLAGPTYELMKGSCTSLIELEYHLEEVYKATTDQLDWFNPKDLVPRTMWIQEPINYDKHALWGVSHWGRKRQQFYGFAVNWESALNVYSKRRIIAIMDLKIVEWHSYKHLDWITVRHDDDKLYKFKEGDFQRLRLQNIKDMLLLFIQGKLSNLTVEERFAFKFSLRMFTRSIVIQRRVEDLQLGVKSYQKRLNLTKPDTYRSDLDGTLNDVRNALDDRLKGIRMQYLPQTIWRKGDKDKAAAMIQAIDKMLKTRRIMKSLERGLEFRTESNNDFIEILKKELETLKKEKEGVDSKLTGFLTASKDLENLIESQRSDKNKEGLGYSAVPPPHAQIYSSSKKDLSWTGLLEFADDMVTDYSRPSPTMESTSDL